MREGGEEGGFNHVWLSRRPRLSVAVNSVGLLYPWDIRTMWLRAT